MDVKKVFSDATLALSAGAMLFYLGIRNTEPQKEALKAPQKITQTNVQNAPLELPTLEQKIESLAVFRGFEAPKFQQYDSVISQSVSRWNKEFEGKANYKTLDANVLKAMMLTESGGHANAWKYDPMQLANKGDTGLDQMRSVDKMHLRPGYSELSNIQHAPWKKTQKGGFWDYEAVPEENRINAELSILFGSRYLIQKAMKFDAKPQIIGFRDWMDAVQRYNGGGDPRYIEKIQKLLDNTTTK